MDLIEDFIKCRTSNNGHGIFRNIPKASVMAKRMTKNEIKKCRHKDRVPSSLFDLFRLEGIDLPVEKYRKYCQDDLAWMLLTCQCKDQATTDMARYLGRILLFSNAPEACQMHRIVCKYQRVL